MLYIKGNIALSQSDFDTDIEFQKIADGHYKELSDLYLEVLSISNSSDSDMLIKK